MNYHSCPDWREDCSNNPFSVFWNMVSKRVSTKREIFKILETKELKRSSCQWLVLILFGSQILLGKKV